MLPYAAYLRVYEPLSAFPGADGRRWAEYAASAGRPRRAGALAAERAESLARAIASSPRPAPERESDHAYVRWSEGVTYICPWQTRLRSWLVLSRLRTAAPSLTRAAFSTHHADAAVRDFARWRSQEYSPRVYIQASTWSVPFAWFVPFAADERWLVLGASSEPGRGGQGDRRRDAHARLRDRDEPGAHPGDQGAGGDPSGQGPADRGAVGRVIQRHCWPSSVRSAPGWRSSTRTPWWNWTTAAWCTCSTTVRSARTSPWRRCPPRSVR